MIVVANPLALQKEKIQFDLEEFCLRRKRNQEKEDISIWIAKEVCSLNEFLLHTVGKDIGSKE